MDTTFGKFNFLTVPGMRDDVAFMVPPAEASRLASEAMKREMEKTVLAAMLPDYLTMPVTADMPPQHPAIKAKALHGGWIPTDNPACADFTETELNDLMQTMFAARSKQSPDIIVIQPPGEQFRFPRSKKRRIRQKWAKRPENWRPRRLLGGWLDQGNRKLYVTPEIAQHAAISCRGAPLGLSASRPETQTTGLGVVHETKSPSGPRHWEEKTNGPGHSHPSPTSAHSSEPASSRSSGDGSTTVKSNAPGVPPQVGTNA